MKSKVDNIFSTICLVIIICFNQNMPAQSTPDSTLYSIPISALNRLFSNFDKQLNTYYLNTGIDLYGSFSKFEYRINQNYRSTLIQTNQNTVRDEEYFFALGKYRLSNGWKQGIALTSNIVSDDRQLGINQATIYQAVTLSELYFIRGLIVTPYGGYSDNRQVNEIDRGPIYGLDGKLNKINSVDFDISSVLRLQNEDISPRKNTIRYLDLLVTNPFNPDVTNFFNALFNQSRKDFYISTDSITSQQFDITNNIESRTETAFLLQDRLNYNNFFNLFSLELAGRVNFRTIDRNTRYKSTSIQSPSIFDTQVDELGIVVESGLFYRTEYANAGINLNYYERDEKHITKKFEGVAESFYEQRSELESRKNNNSYRTTISFLGNIYPSRKDQISLSLFHSKLKYDTPSGENDDDRDELLTIGRLRYSRYLSPFFQIFSNLEGTLSHLVYIFSGRSANNNINRVLRLSAGGYYSGAQFSSLNNFEVSANYTVYDFQDVASNLRSISFRQFTATDSTNYRITKNFSFVVTAYLKLTSQGELDWGNFAERPLRYLQEIFADPKFGIVSDYSFFAIGLRYFSLNTFRYNKTERVPDSDFLSIGPLFEILIGSKMLYLKLNTWYEFISDNSNVNRERLNFILAMNWNF
ncbi:MAG: hypothetical protein MUE91_09095 [Ignavibacteriaceae bacterium]|nr:hypothetical protein [Ignavibacteriaceae bacterium]